MRYLTFSTTDNPAPRPGIVHEGRITDLQGLLGEGTAPPTLLDLIRSGAEVWRATVERVAVRLTDGPSVRTHAFDEVRWHAPIPRPPKNIVCLGLNYASHIRETTSPDRAMKTPEVPVFFTKAPTSVTGPFDPIPWDRSATAQIDYEAELGVVVGIGGKNVPRASALTHIFGYTIVNDVSARDLQFSHKQWFKGKSLDGFCPMGPVVVTADEFGDPQAKRITLRLNGETRQDATTGDMLFPIATIVEQLSRGMTLEAGDLIATGTPEGVGLGRTPPDYLREGDVIETEIEGIGTLRNRVECPP